MSQCGKKENILNSNIFRKKHCFHEIFDKCEREFPIPCVISTVWKNEKLSLCLTEIFSSNQLLFSIFCSKTIAFTNFFSKKVCERIYAISTPQCGNLRIFVSLQKFSVKLNLEISSKLSLQYWIFSMVMIVL